MVYLFCHSSIIKDNVSVMEHPASRHKTYRAIFFAEVVILRLVKPIAKIVAEHRDIHPRNCVFQQYKRLKPDIIVYYAYA